MASGIFSNNFGLDKEAEGRVVSLFETVDPPSEASVTRRLAGDAGGLGDSLGRATDFDSSFEMPIAPLVAMLGMVLTALTVAVLGVGFFGFAPGFSQRKGMPFAEGFFIASSFLATNELDFFESSVLPFKVEFKDCALVSMFIFVGDCFVTTFVCVLLLSFSSAATEPAPTERDPGIDGAWEVCSGSVSRHRFLGGDDNRHSPTGKSLFPGDSVASTIVHGFATPNPTF
mmetsp:Transcript_15635/g.25319  ORF Transcript_15635/g.25319 Transcript_15635/m.25319 type:complete len:229 (-) Transcript_15635:750-1436(-)